MDTTSFIAIAVQCAPLVHASTAQALVTVESGFNPNAIGVVGGVLRRQPKTQAEAMTTAKYLQATGWNFSVGLAQINVHNFERLGLTAATAFDPCLNLRAMQTVLGECFERAAAKAPPQTALRRALSCYYSGDFSTGFKHGYVQKALRVAESAQRVAPDAQRVPTAAAHRPEASTSRSSRPSATALHHRLFAQRLFEVTTPWIRLPVSN
jgi:type IV secretion system protein VirB1